MKQLINFFQRADAVMAPSDVSGESSLTEPLEDNDAGTDGVEEDAAVDQVTEAFEGTIFLTNILFKFPFKVIILISIFFNSYHF